MFEDGGFFTLFIGISFLAPLLTIGLVVLGVVAISRADFDPTGRRPYAFYLFAVCFVALFTLVYSSAAVVTSLSELVGDGNNSDDSAIFFDDSDSSSSGSFDEDSDFDSRGSSNNRAQAQLERQRDADGERDDEIVRTAAQAGTVGLVALGLFAFHWTRARKMAEEPDFVDSPASRVLNAYLYTVCFVAAIVILVAGAIALYGVFRILFPEIASSSGATDDIEREGGLRQFASSGAVLLIGLLLAATHWRQINRPPAAQAVGHGPVSGPPPAEYPPPPYSPGDTSYQRPGPS